MDIGTGKRPDLARSARADDMRHSAACRACPYHPLAVERAVTCGAAPASLVVGTAVGQASGSNPNSRTSCAQRQAAAIFAAHSKAASRKGTSTTVNPPVSSFVSGFLPHVGGRGVRHFAERS